MDLFDRAARRRRHTGGDSQTAEGDQAPQRPGAAQSESGGGGQAQEAQQVIEGTLARLVYSGHDGEFTVARLQVDGQAEAVTIVGALPGVPVGARLRVRGHFQDNPRFGRQLQVVGYTEIAPETLEGIRRYLGSGLIKGIGKEFATRIVDRFGIRTLEILDSEPYRIGEVPGIGKNRALAIRKAWGDQKGVRDVMVFLQGHGVSPAFAARIYRRYGATAVAEVRDNPYRLAFEVWGIGFLSADRLASALGIARDSAVRLQAGVRHALQEAGGQGHVFLPRERLEQEAAQRLDANPDLVRPAVDHLAAAGDIAVERTPELGEICFDSLLYRAECAVACELLRIRGEPTRVPLRLDVTRAIAAYQDEAKLALADAQRDAISLALREKVVVITGGPGVGKTTIVRGIVNIARTAGLGVALAAPTGRAAKRLSEATGQPAQTLHRLLEWRPKESGFGRNAGRPLDTDWLVIDEASMLDVRLAADVLTAVDSGTRLLLVGDVDQLPSVGPGNVLADIITSRQVPTVRLTEIFRQAARSLIVTNAHRINAGEAPEFGAAPDTGADDRDFFFLEENDAGRAASLVRDLVATRLPRRYGLDPLQIQVLVPMRRGDLGAGRLNELLQQALAAGASEHRRGQRVFRLGDRVMQIRNDYDKDVFNGDIGRVVAVSDDGLQVQFEDRTVDYDSDESDQLSLAYAVTVHKSQGSEYPAVVIPIHTQHFVMLQKNLLYTAVTRGKRLVVLVGSRKALSLAVRNGQSGARFSRLADRLRALSHGEAERED